MKPTLKEVAIAFILYVLLGVFLIGIAHAERTKQWEPRRNDRVEVPEFTLKNAAEFFILGAAIAVLVHRKKLR